MEVPGRRREHVELQREQNQTLATEFKVLDLAAVTVTWISGGQIPEDSCSGDALVPNHHVNLMCSCLELTSEVTD